MHPTVLRTIVMIGLLAFLAGCADPRRQCVRDVTAELQALDAQIAASQRALATGTREEFRRPAVAVGVSVCGSPASNVGICADTTRPPQRVLVAVDPAVEGRTLSALQARRAELLVNRDRDIARCAAVR
ncbi:hypothetical protein ACVDG3_15495 [Meridianimarinicoccus sp. RP-17]|uniref:hypothetical protein n=1 Tax=Meridianimarinicoccus zhengii TaxID=2056810 RepID=UPI0013A6A51E|nr:hypothetical protein [Phycocomes zhengii]